MKKTEVKVRNIGNIEQKKIIDVINSNEYINTSPAAIRHILRSYQVDEEKDKLIKKLIKRNEELETQNLLVRKHLLLIDKNLKQQKETAF